MRRIESLVHNNFVETGLLSITDNGEIWREYKHVGGLGRRLVKMHERAERKMPNGYLQVQLYDNGKRIVVSAHGLVWYHFNGGINDRMIIHHKDENKLNNKPENLELVSHSWHNKHHPKTQWNKGKKDDGWHRKTVAARTINYRETIENTYKMKQSGMTIGEIADYYSITKRQVYERINTHCMKDF